MLGRLFALFLVVPLLDLFLLVSIGGRIGLWPTLGIVLLTAAAGSFLARREGAAAWNRVQARMATGGVPGPELIDGLVILLAGALLLTPGFLTDLLGLAGLFPPTRRLARRALRRRFERAVQAGSVRVVGSGPVGGPFGPGAAPFGGGRPPVEDAEVIDDGADPEGAS